MPELYWYCTSCGNPEPAQSEYDLGDWEKCCLCENGTARVVTRDMLEALSNGWFQPEHS